MQHECPSVLLLDDFEDCREAVAAWLSLEGWTAIAVGSADSALEALRQRAVVAVVMEPYLRAGDAMHVAIAARRRPFGAPLLVSMSARGREGDHLGYEPTLFDFNLVKPVPMDKLGEILAMLRSERRVVARSRFAG